MNTVWRKWTPVLAMLGLLGTSPARAAGFFLGETDATANGRVLAVTARLDTPSTIFFNPAGLAMLQGFHLSVGGQAVIPIFKYSDPEGKRPSSTASSTPQLIPHLYASYAITDKWAVGLGFNTPFGLSLKWPVGFAGEARTGAIELKAPTVYLGGAYRPLPWLSFGAALRVMPSTVEMVRRFKLVNDAGVTDYGFLHLGGSAVGFGAVAGVMAEPVKGLHAGFSYLSRVKLSFGNGSANFGLPDGMTDNSVFHDQGGSTSITTPDILSLGVGYEPIDNLYFEFDVNYTLWSVYKELKVHFDNDPSGTLSQTEKKNWKDVPCFRLSGQYTWQDKVAIRLGGGFDMSPTPDETVSPDLPDSDRIFFGIGGGYTYKPLGLRADAAYTLVKFVTRTATAAEGNPFPATYRTIGHMFGITLSVNP